MDDELEDGAPSPESKLVESVIQPLVDAAGQRFLAELDAVTVDDLCRRSSDEGVFDDLKAGADFTI